MPESMPNVHQGTSNSKSESIENPPFRTWDRLKRLGPGLIIAAAIVGSGELFATTLTGAEAGLSLLWLILGGCLVKVFTQIEIGRHTIISGQPTLSAMNRVPGPRFGNRGNWLVWYWFFMWICSVGQLGGILGAVGQSLAISVPITDMGAEYQELSRQYSTIRLAEIQNPDAVQDEITAYSKLAAQYVGDYCPSVPVDQRSEFVRPLDEKLWAIPVAILTAIILYFGRFGLIQSISTVLVAVFTLLTLTNVIRLQMLPDWAIAWQDIASGLIPQLPASEDGTAALRTAIATVGIIGVGAAELIQYPYWCLEKGYARWTGPFENTPAWYERAKGWISILKLDAWISMVIYTVATLAFYLLGAGILHRANIVPANSDLLQMLSVMYKPVFSDWAPIIFLFGAVIVLYSTFFVANASHARTFADAMVVTGFAKDTGPARSRLSQTLSGLFPLLCLWIYWVFPEPKTLVIVSGLAQAVMLPMISGAALYFRYRDCPAQLKPSLWWDGFLWLSSLLMLAIGIFGVLKALEPLG